MQEARRVRSANGQVHPVSHAGVNGTGVAGRADRYQLLRRSPRTTFDLNGVGAVRIRRRRRVSDSFSAIPDLSRSNLA